MTPKPICVNAARLTAEAVQIALPKLVATVSALANAFNKMEKMKNDKPSIAVKRRCPVSVVINVERLLTLIFYSLADECNFDG